MLQFVPRGDCDDCRTAWNQFLIDDYYTHPDWPLDFCPAAGWVGAVWHWRHYFYCFPDCSHPLQLAHFAAAKMDRSPERGYVCPLPGSVGWRI